MTDAYARFCFEHRLPLDHLHCPKGHISQRPATRPGPRSRPGWPSEVDIAWLVVHVASDRLAATVTHERVIWEPWFYDKFGESLGLSLAGRNEEGLTPKVGGKDERRRALKRASEKLRELRKRGEAA